MNKPQLQLPMDESSTETAIWRPIHYLGSKLRLVEPLRFAIDKVAPSQGGVCDLFAGSGTVSAALAGARDIFAVDIQEYSRVLCSAVLNPAHISTEDAREFIQKAGIANNALYDAVAPLIDYEQACLDEAKRGHPDWICELIEQAPVIAFDRRDRPAVRREFERAQRDASHALSRVDIKYVTLAHFGGLYFSYRQAAELDSLLAAAQVQPASTRDTFLAAIISTASEVVNTVGKHFAQPIRPRGADGRPKRHLISKIIRDRTIGVTELFQQWLNRYRSLLPSGRKHRVVRCDYAEALAALSTNVGIVYADPPYTRDHYSRFYHVLETMCLGDDPGISTTRIRSTTETPSRGMYRADRHQSPFCIKSQAPHAFEILFSGVRDRNLPLVLSYSPYAIDSNTHPRVMTVEQIRALAAKYFKKVEQVSAGKLSHMKLNATRLHLDASSEAELIFILT